MSYVTFYLRNVLAVQSLYLRHELDRGLMMQALVNTAMSQIEVAAFVARLKLSGYKVYDFEAGHCVEIDGLQVFRATNLGNERFHVRYHERIFPDV